jgi:hypothetical protein
MEVSGQLHGAAALHPLDRRTGGPQSRSGCGGEEKKSQPPPGIEHRRGNKEAIKIDLREMRWEGVDRIHLA